jgi:hypothetical protein
MFVEIRRRGGSVLLWFGGEHGGQVTGNLM